MILEFLNLISNKKPIIVFGSQGQLGKSIRDFFSTLNLPIVFLERHDCDLSQEKKIIDVLNKYQPQIIINAAGYTNVDKSESNPDLAFLINTRAPVIMAEFISNVPNGMFIYYSTDYVFGDIKNTAYLEDDDTGPIEDLCIYGKSKLAAEKAIERVFKLAWQLRPACASTLNYYIFRTSWLYGSGDNFINKVLHLATKHDKLKVVNDQIGVPTPARWLAEISMQIIDARVPSGIYHAVPDGEISWYELAVFSVVIANEQGLNTKLLPNSIYAVKANEFFEKNIRPYNSRLNNSKVKKIISQINTAYKYPHWKRHVEDYIRECCLKN